MATEEKAQAYDEAAEEYSLPKEEPIIPYTKADIKQAFKAGAKWMAEKAKQEHPEVNLDFQTFAQEMDFVFNLPKDMTENTEENPLNWEYAIARHFYELGLKAKED